MAGTNIGNYYLSVSPSFKGFASSVNSELGGIGSAQGEASGTSFKTGFLKKTVGIGAALYAASGLSDFVSEAVEASDATDKFNSTLDFAGLDTGVIDSLTKSTQSYADKTVYSLSDIQGVTAKLASNSVKDYDKLAEAAGNLNSVAGGSSDTFKSVGMVLTQTAGQGKLTTENWNQLSDAIPGASGKLQEAMKASGAYTGNFRDAMEKGEISAEEFNQSLMDLGMTDAAKDAATSTSTIEGAWGNFQATVVGGLSQFISWIKPAVTTALDGVSSAFQGLFDGLSSLADWISRNKEAIGPFAAAIAGAAAAFGVWRGAIALWSAATKIAAAVQVAFNAVMNANPIMLVVTAIAALVAGLIYFFTQTETGRQIWASFTAWLSGVWASVTAVWNSAWNAISGFLSGLWNGIKSTAESIWNGVVGFFTGIPERIKSGLSALGGLASSMGSWFGSAKDAAVEKFTELVNWVKDIPNKIVSALGDLGSLLYDAGSQIISGLLEGLKGKFNEVQDWVGGVGTWIADHKGPKAYDLQLLVPNGGWIMQGLSEGLEAEFHSRVLGSVGAMGPRLADELNAASTARFSTVSSVSAAAAAAPASSDSLAGKTLILKVGEKEIVAVVDERVIEGIETFAGV